MGFRIRFLLFAIIGLYGNWTINAMAVEIGRDSVLFEVLLCTPEIPTEVVNIICGMVPQKKTVIVVGPSQNGKTAFIKYIFKFMEKKDPKGFIIGDNTTPCTTKSTSYKLSIIPSSKSNVLDSFTDDELYTVDEKRNLPTPAFNWHENLELNFIDTPGLGNDHDREIYEKIHALISDHSLNVVAIVYIRKYDFSRGCEDFFKRVLGISDNIASHVLYLHTNLTYNNVKDEGKLYSHWISRRENKFINDFKDLGENKMKSIRHFYLDSSVITRFDKNGNGKFIAERNMVKILSHIATMEPIVIHKNSI